MTGIHFLCFDDSQDENKRTLFVVLVLLDKEKHQVVFNNLFAPSDRQSYKKLAYSIQKYFDSNGASKTIIAGSVYAYDFLDALLPRNYKIDLLLNYDKTELDDVFDLI